MPTLLAVLVKPELYDFAKSIAIVSMCADAEQASVPLSQVVATCVQHEPNAPVLVDDTIVGRAILVTEKWSLVMPAGKDVPVVVETRRVSLLKASEAN